MAVLLKIETSFWRLEIAGTLPDLPPFVANGVTKVQIDHDASIYVHQRDHLNLIQVSSSEYIEPVFFENVRYDCYLSILSGEAQLSLPLTGSLRHRPEGSSTIHYSINFGNDIGFSTIVVSMPHQSWNIQIEVFPRKIDYRTDYTAIRDDVASITRSLVLTIQARTFGLSVPINSNHPTLSEWVALMRHYFDAFIIATEKIAQNPYSTLERSIQQRSIDKSRRIDTRSLDRILRKPISRTEGILSSHSLPLPHYVPERIKRITYDTAENRYVKAVILQTQKKIYQLLRTTYTSDDTADESIERSFFLAIKPLAQSMLQPLQNLLRLSFLQDVKTVPAIRPSSIVFQHHPQYIAFEKLARILNGGLSLEGEILEIGIKNIALLYEYWCFLRIIDTLRNKLHLEQQNIIKVKHLGITVVLSKGYESSIRFLDRKTGKKIDVVYNKLFYQLPTVSQKPDNIIQLSSNGKIHIFDAKYRLSFDNAYIKTYGGIGPQVEDINTMHRYRDAIVIPLKGQKDEYMRGVVESAIILFPYPEENTFIHQRFYLSISSIQVGGIPLLPKSSHLFEKQLFSILRSEGIDINEDLEL